MKIVHIAAEMAPIAKVGGLGEVLGGLTQALSKENLDVVVILPKYKNINTKHLKDLKAIKRNFKVYEKLRWQINTIYQAKINGVKIILIEDKKKYFTRPKIYGYKNDVARFLYFCKAALEFLYLEDKPIDILHIHDWHTSIIAVLYKEIYSYQKAIIKKIVLSIHNLKYQGLCKPKDIDNLDVEGRSYLKEEKLKDPKKPRTLNFLKGGIIYSDYIIPVSENYAKELLSKEHSYNLHYVIEKNKKKIKGIINGIDQKFWNPQNDPHFNYNYSESFSLKKLIEAKKKNKKVLQKKLNLSQIDVPIICSIGRLVGQKGPFLIKHALIKTIKNNSQFVLLGSTFDKKMSRTFSKLKTSLKNNKNSSLTFEYNEKLSHLIFAAADYIIIPSLFEPCGLTQMIAFKYATIPIVRKTGGLADTVFDLDDKNIPKSKRNGFTFKKFSNEGVDSALKRAIKFWYEKRDDFYKLALRNMKDDFSWKQSAQKYLKVYKKLLKQKTS